MIISFFLSMLVVGDAYLGKEGLRGFAGNHVGNHLLCPFNATNVSFFSLIIKISNQISP